MSHNPPTMLQAAAFLKRWAPGLRKAARADLLLFVLWYWSDGRLGMVRDNGRIVAVALARCVDDVIQASDPWFHNEQGKIVWVDDIVSRHPLGIPLLLQQVRRRFGPREAFAGRVFHRDGELRMLPMRIVERLTTGETHHGITLYSGAAAAA